MTAIRDWTTGTPCGNHDPRLTEGTGRCFYVIGRKGSRCHAWTVVDGTPARAYQPPFRYRVFEVTA